MLSVLSALSDITRNCNCVLTLNRAAPQARNVTPPTLASQEPLIQRQTLCPANPLPRQLTCSYLDPEGKSHDLHFARRTLFYISWFMRRIPARRCRFVGLPLFSRRTLCSRRRHFPAWGELPPRGALIPRGPDSILEVVPCSVHPYLFLVPHDDKTTWHLALETLWTKSLSILSRTTRWKYLRILFWICALGRTHDIFPLCFGTWAMTLRDALRIVTWCVRVTSYIYLFFGDYSLN